MAYLGNTEYRRKKKKRTLKLFVFIFAVCLCIAGWMIAEGLAFLRSQELPDHLPEETLPDGPSAPELPGAASSAAEPAAPSAAYRHFESALSGEERKQYIEIREAIASAVPGIEFKTGNLERLMELAVQIHQDYPEYFWFSGKVHTSYRELFSSYSGTLSFSYDFPASEIESRQAELEAASRPLLSRLSGKSDYEKVKGVYEELINSTAYQKGEYDQTCYSVLVNHRGVCAGYAAAMKYLLDRLGVDSIIVSGTSKGEDHAWNIVKVQGEWYQTDVTWGDPVMNNGSPFLSYDYLLLDDAEMQEDHQPDPQQTYPVCSSETYNYFKAEGLYLEEYSAEELLRILQLCISRNTDFIFKCADRFLYAEVKDYLFEKQNVFTLLKRAGVSAESIDYYTDDDHRAIYIRL